jgi:hypothetical protein
VRFSVRAPAYDKPSTVCAEQKDRVGSSSARLCRSLRLSQRLDKVMLQNTSRGANRTGREALESNHDLIVRVMGWMRMAGPASQAGTIAASSRPLRRIRRPDRPPWRAIHLRTLAG